MKKLLALLLAALVMVSLAACVPTSDLDRDPTECKSSYVPSDQAKVASSFVVNGDAKFIIDLTDGADVDKVGIACMYFDENGKLLSDYEILTCKVENEKRSSWETGAPADCLYAVATIAFTTDSQGNKETCVGVDDWAKETEASFSVSAHKVLLAAWAQLGATAEINEYVKIESLVCDNDTLEIELTNLKNYDIPKLHVYLLLYDENGYPMDVGGNSCPNSKLIELTNLLAEENATYEYNIPNGTVSVKAVLRMVQTGEEETWNNPYLYEWLYSNYATAP